MIIALALTFFLMTDPPAQSNPDILWEYKTGG